MFQKNDKNEDFLVFCFFHHFSFDSLHIHVCALLRILKRVAKPPHFTTTKLGKRRGLKWLQVQVQSQVQPESHFESHPPGPTIPPPPPVITRWRLASGPGSEGTLTVVDVTSARAGRAGLKMRALAMRNQEEQKRKERSKHNKVYGWITKQEKKRKKTNTAGSPSAGRLICSGLYEFRFCNGLTAPIGMPTLRFLSTCGLMMKLGRDGAAAAERIDGDIGMLSRPTGLVLV